MDCSSHGAKAGAFQPLAAPASLTVTVQPLGGSRVKALVIAARARWASTVGGVRNESARAVYGRRTLPASATGGSPCAPVTDKVGRQVLARISSAGSLLCGRVRP